MSVDGVDLVVVDLLFALILALTLSQDHWCDHLPLLSEILSIQFSKHPLEFVHLPCCVCDLVLLWLTLQYLFDFSFFSHSFACSLWTRSIVRSRSALRSLAWSAPGCRWQMWKVSSCPPGCKRWRWCQSCRSWSVHHFWAKLSSRFTSRVVCGDWLYRWTWSSAAWKLGALALPVRRFRCSSCPRRPWWLVQILFEMKLRRPEKSSASQNEIFVNQPFVPNFSKSSILNFNFSRFVCQVWETYRFHAKLSIFLAFFDFFWNFASWGSIFKFWHENPLICQVNKKCKNIHFSQKFLMFLALLLLLSNFIYEI